MNFTSKMKILQTAIDKYKIDSQVSMLVEECAELIADINRYYRKRIKKEKLIEEMVDVSIMIDQMKLIFGGSEWDRIENEKLKRLESIINE